MPDSEPLEPPSSLAEVLRKYDSRTDGFEEEDLSFALERELKECGEIPDQQRKAGFAEVAAFQFMVEPFTDKSPWNTRRVAGKEVLRRPR